jgi:putative DNA primase/helicase
MAALDLARINDVAERVRSVVAAVAPAPGWPPLDPLPDARDSSPQAFPFHGLGKLLGDAARSIAEGVQAPDALAGGSVLASAALAAQAHADVVMPHGQRAPLSVFVVTGALSGDRKTAIDAVASLPAEEHRREQARDHAAALARYEEDRAAARQKGEPDIEKPVAKSLTIGKATVEGLHMMLRKQSHVGVFTGEGGELLGGHSLREDRRSAGLAWFLKAWGAETLDTLTRGDGLSILLGRRVAMHAMVQPVLLRSLLVDPLAQGQGFLARCLVSEPGTLAGTRLFKPGNPADAPSVRAYHAALRDLLMRPARVHQRGDGFELDTRALALSAEAAALWVEFYNAIETEQSAEGELRGARAFASKGAEHAARIAGIVQMVNAPDAAHISVETMAEAIAVASFYISEHVRLTGAGKDDRHHTALRTLLAWLQERGRTLHKDVLQRSPNPIRELKAKGINTLLDELAQRGYIRRDGDAWEVRPWALR